MTVAALAAAMLTGITAPAAAAEPEKPTAEEYTAWLEEKNDSGADRVADQFTALSDEDQQKFLGYLVDPEALEALSNAMSGVGPERVEVGGGDVVVEGTTETAATRGTAGDWNCTSKFTQSIFGVDITRLNLKQWYHSTTTQVDKVYNAAASKTNYNVGVHVTHEPEEQWISAAGNALAYVTWEGHIVYDGFGVSMDKRHHVRCDETGFRYHYLNNV